MTAETCRQRIVKRASSPVKHFVDDAKGMFAIKNHLGGLGKTTWVVS
jgi:hypothetical protein